MASGPPAIAELECDFVPTATLISCSEVHFIAAWSWYNIYIAMLYLVYGPGMLPGLAIAIQGPPLRKLPFKGVLGMLKPKGNTSW